MKKNKKTAPKLAERPKLTDARDKTRGAKGGGKTEGARETQSEAGVRCSALLGDAPWSEERKNRMKNRTSYMEVYSSRQKSMEMFEVMLRLAEKVHGTEITIDVGFRGSSPVEAALGKQAKILADSRGLAKEQPPQEV